MGYANRKVSCSSSLAVTTTLRSLSYFVRRIPKSSGNVLSLRLSRISYVICISYVISIVVVSRSALNVLCLLLYPRNHWQHHVNKVKSSSCSSWIKTLLRLIFLLVRWLQYYYKKRWHHMNLRLCHIRQGLQETSKFYLCINQHSKL